MNISRITVSGFRGFSQPASLMLAIPNGQPGSGLTILTGSNTSGKSSLIEAFGLFYGQNNIDVPKGMRNKNTSYEVYIKVEIDTGNVYECRSDLSNPKQIVKHRSGTLPFEIITVPASRRVDQNFQNNMERKQYLDGMGYSNDRWSLSAKINHRLPHWRKNREEINSILYRIVDRTFEWSVDETHGGQQGLIITTKEFEHTADGMGDGIAKLIYIVDALYDRNEKTIILIDEPEVCLNPYIQKKLFDQLVEVSKNHQIVIATHSPYFIAFEYSMSGMKLYRFANYGDGTKVFEFNESAKKFYFESQNYRSSYLHGVEAREVFFIPDKIVLVEGQDDAYLIQKLTKIVTGFPWMNIYGYGAGGHGNIPKIKDILHSLGYKKVVCIYDKGVHDCSANDSSGYLEIELPTFDIRDKEKDGKRIEGIFDSSGEIKVDGDQIKYIDFINLMKKSISDYFEIRS